MPDNDCAPGLLERERELAALDDAVVGCVAGQGGAVVVEGPAGIGKTSLLSFVRGRAADAGVRVVSARGAELERSYPYGIVRQFFESFLFTVEADERPGWLRSTSEMAARMFGTPGQNEPADEFALLHSLYWMCVKIADERPLLMVLDDGQWADPLSLSFVEFTCRRLEQVPFLFVVATRVPDESSPPQLVALVADRSAVLLRPSPLSVGAVEQLVRARVDERADASFTRACHEVTSGNPFLLGELVREVLDEQLPATAEAASRVRAIGPRGVSRVVLLRLRRLPETARHLAAALSVARDGLTLGELGSLVGIDEATAADAAAALERADIISLRDGVRFAHPVVGAAVYADLPAVEQARLHLGAARLKADRGRPPEEIAVHLLHVEPGDDPWVKQTLRAAARHAAGAGDFLGAEQLLTRVLRKQLSASERAELLAELGAAEARTGNPQGTVHLAEAARAIEDPQRSAAASIELSNVLKFSLRADEAADVLAEALHRLQLPSAAERRLKAELLGARFISPLTQDRISRELATLDPPDDEPQDLLDAYLLAASGFDAVAEVAPADAAIALGRRALSGDVVPADMAGGGQALIVATVALIWAEDFDFVYRRLSGDLLAARSAGSALAVGNLSTMRAMCCYRAGRLLEAEADASCVLELADQVNGLQTLLPPAAAYAVLSGIDRGSDLKALNDLVSNPAFDQAPQLLPYTQLSWARGELALACEQWESALSHLQDCQRANPGYGGQNPAMVPWREGSAIAHARLGDREFARRLAADAVERARRFGARRALGSALRAAALIEEGDKRIGGLADAADILGTAPAPLELARVQSELGAALRAAGRRTDAQDILEQARQGAHSLGAARIQERATEELVAAGVKPRREPAVGPAALTPSERRVAELAAAGKTNREIAQSLFVTEKTVETHLGHIYDKLGVRSRRKLPQALELPRAA